MNPDMFVPYKIILYGLQISKGVAIDATHYFELIKNALGYKGNTCLCADTPQNSAITAYTRYRGRYSMLI